MAKIKIDATEAAQSVKDLNKEVKDLDKNLDETNKSASENIKKTGKEVEDVGNKTKTGFGKVGNGLSSLFKGLGTVMKATGIVGILSFMWEALQKNQKFMDLLNGAVNGLTIVIKPLVDGISDFVTKLAENKELSEKTGKVLKDLITIGFTPLKISFQSIKLVMESLQLAWKKSIFGGNGKDIEGIKELTNSISETKNEIGEIATKAVDAGKDFAKNIGGVVKGVSDLTKKVVTDVIADYKKMDLQGAMAQGNNIERAKKHIAALEEEQRAIQIKYEQEAEQQRQIRDDVTKTNEERLAASNKIIDIIETQRVAEEKIIKQKIADQNTINSLDQNNAEGKLALIKLTNDLAENNKKATEQMSEQITSHNGVVKEGLDKQIADQQLLVTTAQDSLNKILENEKSTLDEKLAANKEYYDEQIKLAKLNGDDLNKIAKNQADAEAKIKSDATKKAAEDAVKAAETSLNNVNSSEKSSLKDKLDANKAYYEQKLALAKINGEDTIKLLNDQLSQENALRNAEIDKRKEQALASTDYIKNLDEQLTTFKTNLLSNQLKNGKLSQEEYDKKIAEIEKKAAKRKKAYAIAETVINTAASIVKFLSNPGGIPGIALSVAAGIMGAAQIATIASTPIDGSGGSSSTPSSSMSSSTSESTAPQTSFSFDTIQPKAAKEQPIKTYVVGNDITTQQNLDRQKVSIGTL
jgi:hypothetical protein